jgi:predicted ATPase/DNA-binding CsgD family transcriptional regulator/class 3 adenylate cyclase
MPCAHAFVVLVVSQLLPKAMATLLLAEVENSARLRTDNSDDTTAALALLDRLVAKAVAAHGGVRSVERGKHTSFVAVFEDAGAAVVCALAVQQTQLGTIRLRIGVHTSQVPLRYEGGFTGSAINCAARLCDLAHGGQILLSGTTEELVAHELPGQAWLVHLGRHRLGDQCGPERVSRLCHPDLPNEAPSLRADTVAAYHLPVQLTSFVGREAAITELRRILAHDQVVTLVGAGGVGKTRLAIKVAAQMACGFGDGVRCVDLASITDPDMVRVTVARSLGLPDQPGRSTMETLIGFMADRQLLVVLDNCEHLLDECAALIVALCSACPGLKILATSREPLAVPGEVIWQVPSLSLPDEAIELFSDRARRARPGFSVTDDTAPAMMEICRRLDGLPLAIELAAARVRTLSLPEILDSLHDRFRMLIGGARTAVRRQQTLRASVDWSHALLSEPEKTLFRRLAVFMGGFDSTAAQVVTGDCDIDVLDQLGSLVDKSLVIAKVSRDRTRYQLLETVRLYAQEKLAESGEADAVRSRQRQHYLGLAIQFDAAANTGNEQRIELVEAEIDNLRAAFSWSCERRDIEEALQLASSLQPLWLTRGRIREGLAWLDAVLTEATTHGLEVTAALQARAMADKATLVAWIGATNSLELAEHSLAIARTVDDPALIARALTACVTAAAFNPEVIQPYFNEAVTLARVLGDDWRLSQILGAGALAAYAKGDPIAARAVAEEGRELADAIGDGFISRRCRWCLAWTQSVMGAPGSAAVQFQQVAVEADRAQDTLSRVVHLLSSAMALAQHGDAGGARAAADAAIAAGAKFGGEVQGLGYAGLAVASMAAGDVAVAAEANEKTWHRLNAGACTGRAAVRAYLKAEVALAHGDPIAARRWADQAVSATSGIHLMQALTTRARVAIAQGRTHDAESFAREALTCAAAVRGYAGIPDIVECLAQLAVSAGKEREAARLFGAAQTMREQMSVVRFKIYDAGYEASIATLRKTMPSKDFDSGWAEGAARSIDEVVSYLQRGRGERKRPASGWPSLTPTERDVVRLVSEGLTNKDIATKLFVSPRTVQTHLTHVYTKLGLTSRVQLVQEAASHASQ